MSFFNRGANTPPHPPSGTYKRIDQSLPTTSRSGMRQPPQSTQYNAPSAPYNDPANAFYEKRQFSDSSNALFDNKQHHVPSFSGASASGSRRFEVVGSPNNQLALTNCMIVHPTDFPDGQHVLINKSFPITLKHDNANKLQPRMIGTSAAQRQWMGLSMTGDSVAVEALPSPPHPNAPPFLQSIDVEVGFARSASEIAEVFSADDMAKIFLKAYNGIVMAANGIIFFEYHGQFLKANVKAVSTLDLADEQRRGAPSGGSGGQQPGNFGIIMDRTDVTILKAPDSKIKIKSSATKAPPNAILAPNFKFEDMGIGGLDSEFAEIFRRAFASRVFPPGLVEKLGIEHVKGILLHGPPGTGKTLIARQIGKMLNAREPKIVNGPEVLSKYVGASEENIRKLFADAEKEYKEKGEDSGLHIIIFDELDAIFKQRGSTNNGTGVGDSVVNQLLSKMDGVDKLNNILIIGMTNRKDMIDEALLRPGRLEVHMEISLPDENGRYQILGIHTNKMRMNAVMESDVDLHELAASTKNFSGAEISGLIKSASSFALNRHVKVGTVAGISDDVANLRVNRRDFLNALDEVHPAFGVSEEELAQAIQNGIIHFDSVVDEILRSGELLVEQVRSSTRTHLVSVLLHGPPGAGKTALGVSIAQASEFPFIKLISPDNMVGYSESQKVAAITKVFADSYKSPLSVIVVDNMERLIDWTPMGARFSNAVLQTLLVLFGRIPPKSRRLLIIATSSQRPILSDLGFTETFDSELRVPPITKLNSLEYILREVELLSTSQERQQVIRSLHEAGFESDALSSKFQIGIKKLLSIIEMARQEPDDVAQRLIGALMGLLL
ncbi:hypothetical protein H2248_006720 [Termitomyces sp. 'cryptogamus']|nr:hypothetical protein H2248_006720 [Termitomyces sp. 'cryptogamus']